MLHALNRPEMPWLMRTLGGLAALLLLGACACPVPDSQRAAEPGSRSGPGRTGKLATGIETAVRQAAGLDAVLQEEHGELLRFVTRMAAAAESRDLLGGDAPVGAGVAFPPLKRRIRSMPPEKAAQAWLARFRALAGDRIATPASGEAGDPAKGMADASAS